LPPVVCGTVSVGFERRVAAESTLLSNPAWFGACDRTRRRRFALHGGDRDTWTVSSANLEFVRSISAAWERGDFGSVEWVHPDIELVFADGPDPSNWTGLAEISDGFRNFLSALVDLGLIEQDGGS
jgi:hypothetical protein